VRRDVLASSSRHPKKSPRMRRSSSSLIGQSYATALGREGCFNFWIRHMPEQNDSSRMLVQPEGRAALAALLADLRSCFAAKPNFLADRLPSFLDALRG
jgi:hypothetical protein